MIPSRSYRMHGRLHVHAWGTKSATMMMIAFITINSGLVLLIEGLCAQILIIKDLRLSVGCVHLLLVFFGRKFMLKKKAISLSSHPASHIHTYTCVLCTHIRIHICRDLVHLDSSAAVQVSHPISPPWIFRFLSFLNLRVFITE